MRDPKRIDPIIAAFTAYWKSRPDYRFQQAVLAFYYSFNLSAGISDDYFYTEDSSLLAEIEAHAEN